MRKKKKKKKTLSPANWTPFNLKKNVDVNTKEKVVARKTRPVTAPLA